MTEIAWQDGGPVFRDGKLGTGQACCCGGPCDCFSAMPYSSGIFVATVIATITEPGTVCSQGSSHGQAEVSVELEWNNWQQHYFGFNSSRGDFFLDATIILWCIDQNTFSFFAAVNSDCSRFFPDGGSGFINVSQQISLPAKLQGGDCLPENALLISGGNDLIAFTASLGFVENPFP